jgi:hypothetical protein
MLDDINSARRPSKLTSDVWQRQGGHFSATPSRGPLAIRSASLTLLFPLALLVGLEFPCFEPLFENEGPFLLAAKDSLLQLGVYTFCRRVLTIRRGGQVLAILLPQPHLTSTVRAAQSSVSEVKIRLILRSANRAGKY